MRNLAIPFVYILKIFYFEYSLENFLPIINSFKQTKISLHLLISTSDKRRRAYENIYIISYYHLLLIRHSSNGPFMYRFTSN